MSRLENTLMIFAISLIAFITVMTAKEAINDNKLQTKILFSELKANLKALHHSNTLPLMQTMKEQFDRELSIEELAELNDLRFRYTELKKLQNAERETYLEQIKRYRESNIEFDKEELKRRYSKYANEHALVVKKISEISLKYSNKLSDLYAEYSDDFEKIRVKREKIIEHWKTMYAKELSMASEEYLEKKYKKLRSKTNPFMSDLNKTELTKLFLLWDGFSKAGY